MITVRRRHIWKDAMSKLNKYCTIDFQKPLYIDFVGEDGDDFGGLTREFFSLCFLAAEGEILQGPTKMLSPIPNNNKLVGREFYNFGLLIALALTHGCVGPCNLSPAVAKCLLGYQKSKNQVTISEIPDFELQEKLNKVMKSTDDKQELMQQLEERYDAGIPLVTGVSKTEFCQIISFHRILGVNKDEIDQIICGLKDNGV